MLSRLRAVGEGLLRRALAEQPYTLDCDSTVETVYGEQDGARPGPNPHKRGRASYRPLLCRERKSGLMVHRQLRPGDTGSATGAVDFLRQAIRELKEDFGIDRIASSAFGANAADLEMKVLAFNLLVRYQRQAWAGRSSSEPRRSGRVIAIAGTADPPAGQWMLKLAERWLGQADLARVRQHLATLGPERHAPPHPQRTDEGRSVPRAPCPA